MVIHIPLSKYGKKRGQFEAIVDDCDAEFVLQFNWCVNHGTLTNYAIRVPLINGKKQVQLMHRIILESIIGRPLEKNEDVDHRDGNGLNNCRDNLRLATRSQNLQNIGKKRMGKNKYKGVYWNKKSNKYQVQITANGKTYNLGVYRDEYEASQAYKEAAKKLHGDFANLGEESPF